MHAVPMPLPPAWMSTDWPARSPPSSSSDSCAVMKASGVAAACTKDQPSGMGTAIPSSMRHASA